METTEASSTDNKESANKENEAFSQNGFVTCRIFEKWLLNCFVPYLNELEGNKNKKNVKIEAQPPVWACDPIKSEIYKKKKIINKKRVII